MNVMVLLVRSFLVSLLIEKLSELSLLNVLSIDSFIISKHVVVLDDIDVLIVGDEGLIVVGTMLLNLLDGLADEEPVLLLVKLVRVVDQREQEDIVVLVLVVHLQLNLLI